jgi:hypothetical protein
MFKEFGLKAFMIWFPMVIGNILGIYWNPHSSIYSIITWIVWLPLLFAVNIAVFKLLTRTTLPKTLKELPEELKNLTCREYLEKNHSKTLDMPLTNFTVKANKDMSEMSISGYFIEKVKEEEE